MAMAVAMEGGGLLGAIPMHPPRLPFSIQWVGGRKLLRTGNLKTGENRPKSAKIGHSGQNEGKIGHNRAQHSGNLGKHRGR
jgi:hypothetical protein